MLLLLLQSPRVYPVSGIGAGVTASTQATGASVTVLLSRNVTVTPVKR